jgi:hypothetical protein
MAYRSDLEALQARHNALVAEVAERVRERDTVGRLLAELRPWDAAVKRLAEAEHRARRRRRYMLIASVLAILAIVGGFGIRAALRDPARELIDQYKAFADRMCECRDSTCAGEVAHATSAWAVERREAHDGPLRLDVAQRQHLNDVRERMVRCMASARSVAH